MIKPGGNAMDSKLLDFWATNFLPRNLDLWGGKDNYCGIPYLDFGWLKANHQMIHYFGLGFIQLKINNYTRMHFYHPTLKPIVAEGVHNHRYSFGSLILKGELKQSIFAKVPGDTHICEQESCKEGACVEAAGTPCGLEFLVHNQYREGSQYTINHSTFHQVESPFGITLLNRTEYKKELAEVIRPVGAEKVCPFSHKVEEDKLWDIVKEMLAD